MVGYKLWLSDIQHVVLRALAGGWMPPPCDFAGRWAYHHAQHVRPPNRLFCQPGCPLQRGGQGPVLYASSTFTPVNAASKSRRFSASSSTTSPLRPGTSARAGLIRPANRLGRLRSSYPLGSCTRMFAARAAPMIPSKLVIWLAPI